MNFLKFDYKEIAVEAIRGFKKNDDVLSTYRF